MRQLNPDLVMLSRRELEAAFDDALRKYGEVSYDLGADITTLTRCAAVRERQRLFELLLDILRVLGDTWESR